MAEPVTSYIIENDEDFKRALERLGKTTSDFRIPFGSISRAWYRNNRKIFALKSEGKYPPLGGFKFNEKVMYKGELKTRQFVAEERKKERAGFVFPLLAGKSGRLAASILSPNAAGSEFFIGKQTLIMGTNVPYAKFHQSDETRKKLPLRKIIFIDGGPLETSKGTGGGNRNRFLNIINDHIVQVLTGKI